MSEPRKRRKRRSKARRAFRKRYAQRIAEIVAMTLTDSDRTWFTVPRPRYHQRPLYHHQITNITI